MIGLIGCGGIAQNKYLPVLTELSAQCEIIAFCDVAEVNAVQTMTAYGNKNAKIYTNYKDLLANEEIDVVHILTPNATHCQISIDAFNAGKHVLCEKPMAITGSDAAKMVEAWKKSGKKFTVGYQNRFRSEVMAMHEAVKDIGEIYYARAHAVRRRGIPTWGVFTNKALQGGGPLIDIGTHALDMALWMMNNYEPEYVMGQTFCKLATSLHGGDQGVENQWDPNNYDVEDSAFGMIKMANGAVIYLESSWALNVTNEHQHAVTLCGTKGGLELRANGVHASADLVFNTTKYGRQLDTFSPANNSLPNHRKSRPKPALLEAAQWIDAILNDKEPLVSPLQAQVVTQILEAIYQSAKTGEAVKFCDGVIRTGFPEMSQINAL
jgi:predicted dehydrogenase